MIWTKSLDPGLHDYKWSAPVVVASSDGIEDANAIDPAGHLEIGARIPDASDKPLTDFVVSLRP